MHLRNILQSVAVIILPAILFPPCENCDLKGMVGNRVQCVLHDLSELVNQKNNETEIPWLEQMVKDLDPDVEDQLRTCGIALDCNKGFFKGDDMEAFKKKVLQTQPGTRWCSGDNSTTLNCCNEHSECKVVLKSNESRFGLTNPAVVTRFHCDCDRKLYYCLKEVNDNISQQIGYTYFNVFRPQCFKVDYPVVHCIKDSLGRCIEYKFDLYKPKQFQWFHNHIY